MVIGIDIDGVYTDLDAFQMDYFSRYCMQKGIAYTVTESKYNVADTFCVDPQVEEDFWEEHLDWYADNYPARPFAAEVTRKLKEEGNEIVIVTARTYTCENTPRGDAMRSKVRNWLDRNNICYDKLVFAKSAAEDKRAELAEHGISVMVEDSPQNIRMLSSLAKIICYDASYNRDLADVPHTRCYSWWDIYREITRR